MASPTLGNRRVDIAFPDLLQVSNAGAGLDGTLRPIASGSGTDGPFNLSTTKQSFPSGKTLELLAGSTISIAASVTVTFGSAITAIGPLTVTPASASAGAAGAIHLRELAANGVHKAGFRAADSLAGDAVWILPTADGTSGQVLVTDGSFGLSFTNPTLPSYLDLVVAGVIPL